MCCENISSIGFRNMPEPYKHFQTWDALWCCSQKVLFPKGKTDKPCSLVFYKEKIHIQSPLGIQFISSRICIHGTNVCKHCEDHAIYTDMNAAQELSNSTPCAAGQKRNPLPSPLLSSVAMIATHQHWIMSSYMALGQPGGGGRQYPRSTSLSAWNVYTSTAINLY